MGECDCAEADNNATVFTAYKIYDGTPFKTCTHGTTHIFLKLIDYWLSVFWLGSFDAINYL